MEQIIDDNMNKAISQVVEKTLVAREVAKTTPQERTAERSQSIEVPKISCWRSAEVVKSFPQERISERMCEQRTVEQSLDDTWLESFSRFLERRREQLRKGEKEKETSLHQHW